MTRINADTILAAAYTPVGAPAEPEARPVFSNVDHVERANGTTEFSRDVPEIYADFVSLCGSARRVGNNVYVNVDNEPQLIKRPQQLMAFVERFARVEWHRSGDRCPAGRFLEYVTLQGESFETLELFPHFPPRPTACYFHAPVPDDTGTDLEHFISFFSPASDSDSDLMKAFVLSLFWGGHPGSRPIWIFTAADDDPQQGRGTGKSKFVELAADLCGGFMSISPQVKFADIVKRLLSPVGLRYRVARIDNLKSLRFSWADLEECLTSPVISGHEMFHGEGRRPNLLTWAITVNSPSVSKDIAQRAIVVKVRRPQHRPGWENEVREFVEQRRWHIIADVRAALRSCQDTNPDS